MILIRSLFAFFIIVILSLETADAETLPRKDNQPLLAPKIHGVSGVPITIYFDNLILSNQSDELEFKVDCNVGHRTAKGWTIGNQSIKPGEYPILISTIDSNGRTLAAKSVVVVNARSIQKNNLRLMIVGDSLTNATIYTNRIAELLNQNKKLKWTMLGTRNPRSKIPGVNHEGYSGRTWAWFLNHYEPMPEPAKKKWTSPFVFKIGQEKPKVDFQKYLNIHSDGIPPDVITVLLGINDCFSAGRNPDKTAKPKIKAMLSSADQLIAEFQKVSPKAKIGICITPPPNSRSSAFVANYKTSYTRDGWRVVLRELQKRLIDHFKKRENENLYLVPTHLNLDVTDGFPVNNAVHPNAKGYNQIGDTIYSWIVSVTH